MTDGIYEGTPAQAGWTPTDHPRVWINLEGQRCEFPPGQPMRVFTLASTFSTQPLDKERVS
jgi:hypothetical protein